jgi:hypothetical protein
MIAQMRDIAKIIAATAAGFSMQACGPGSPAGGQMEDE